MDSEVLERWTCAKSAELYGIHDWATGYFDISAKGEVIVRPKGAGSDVSVSLTDIVAGLRQRGLGLPVLLRFGDILESRLKLLNESFASAMRDAGYQGKYRGVYPIKVNQQQQVVEEIVRVGGCYHHGLEVGSKAELVAALASLDDPEAFLVCNGYKDEEFITLALYAQKMGLNPILVLEMTNELPDIIACAKRLNLSPRLGIRVKLSSRVGGMWTESGGDRSFFGLTTSEIVEVVDTLKEHNMLNCLHMLHYHLGSQIPNIRSIRAAAREATRFYIGLVREGAPMGLLNIGGGLAVDYDGSHTNFPSSSNYTIAEYCADILEVVMTMINEAGLQHPTIISESGRATVSHHSVLLFDVLDVSTAGVGRIPESLPPDAHELLKNLLVVRNSLSNKNVQEAFHDATFYRDEIRSLFLHEGLSLRERATAEEIFWDVARRIARESREMKYVPDEIENLEVAISDVYYCNFSVFQSLPDAWAIGQLFPIMPIHRLNERPTRNATLADITCDCDGKIDKFIDLHDVKPTLTLHEPGKTPYILGAFLVGAYQETLGDLHNLLGDTNVVSVRVGANGNIEFHREIVGDSVADVLSYVEYDPKDLISQVRTTAEKAVQRGEITPADRREIMDAYETGLRGYTYFED
ncbi:MAG: arginine decarboxylase [Lentisphaerae bacterium RIFOXYB12_FULL_65_16]|nr:MAG: arginine decarboxylase [Lentisphaerae bacterium RIFOXYA12_64_32]OGV84352.1 MAG: arginine decarboxylase [Lentisphaerae bacterium RIFOXYB12_FULL_65_16]